jgi:hypothetical protein
MVSSNETRKYALYAIGEILLVMVGILLALQVSNWNEDRNRRKMEDQLLASFHTELEFHHTRIDDIIRFNEVVLNASEELAALLSRNAPYGSRLDTLFYISTAFTFGDQFSSAALDNLKSAGVDIISNQELRNKLILVYDKFSYLRDAQKIYVEMVTQAGQTILSTRFEDLWKGDFDSYMPVGSMRPLDYTALLKDEPYLYFLRSIPNHLGWFVFNPCKYMKAEIEEVLALLKQEIDMSQDL